MSARRVLILSSMLVVGGWALWVAWSLIGSIKSVPDFAVLAPTSVHAEPLAAIINAADETISPPVDGAVPVLSVPEAPESEPIEAEPEIIELSVLDPPLTVMERCVLMRDIDSLLVYGGNKPGRRVVEYYAEMSDAELQARADMLGDGFAQYYFAKRLWRQLYVEGVELTDEIAEQILKYQVDAIRNHVWGRGGDSLALLSYLLGNTRDVVGWLTVDQRMEGDGFYQFQMRAAFSADGSYLLQQYELDQGELRAEELIAAHELSDGLIQPAECRDQ